MKVVGKNFTRKCPQDRFSQKNNSWGDPWAPLYPQPWSPPTHFPTVQSDFLITLRLESTESTKWDDLFIVVLDFLLDPAPTLGPCKPLTRGQELMCVQDKCVHSSLEMFPLQRLNPKGVISLTLSCSFSKLFLLKYNILTEKGTDHKLDEFS